MAQTTRKIELNIKNSVNTDSISEDTYLFEDQGAPLLKNTGIERNGGVLNVYETEVTLPANSASYVAPSGALLSQLPDGSVQVDGTTIGNVSPYGVRIRDTIANVDDVIFSTSADTYITAVFDSANRTVIITEYYIAGQQIVTQNIPSSPLFPATNLEPSTTLEPSGVAGAPVHRRSITFPSLPSTLYTSLSFVRTASVNWDGDFQFCLRQGNSVSILREQFAGTILTIPALLSGYDELNYLYAYQYENLSYFVCLIGNSMNNAFITDNGFSTVTQNIRCQYPVAQVHNHKSRHLISSAPVVASGGVQSLGYVGYYDFTNFIATVQWVGPTTNGSSAGWYQPVSFNTGYGYSEYTQKDPSGNYWNFNSPAFDYNPTIQYNFRETQNTSLLYNYYGKFTNIYSLTPSVPFEFRVIWVNGIQSALSVALFDSFPGDHLGTLITEFGNFDDTYCPLIVNDDTILYKYNNNYYIIAIDTAANVPTSTIPQIQQISPVAFKLDTISPINILDLQTQTLLIGSCDYNGRMAFSSTAPQAQVQTEVVSTYNGKYSNGIDGGVKLSNITTPGVNNIEVIGYRVDGLQSFLIDTYVSPPTDPAGTPLYAFSTTSTGAELVDPSRSGTLYTPNTVLPFALGDLYNLNVATTVDSTVFYNTTGPISVGTAVSEGDSIGYDGYTLGNDIPGLFVSFRLQGQQYLQDATWIYKVSIQNNIYQSKDQFAPATGLKYIASSPTTIYFVSSFDNSLYAFTGGATLSKAKRFNSCDTILSGVFSVMDDTLLFNATNSFIWVRDGVVTINPKKSNQSGAVSLYETVDNIVIANANYRWAYTYNDPATEPVPANTSYSVVPLYFQTAFLGLGSNQRAIVREWVITIYNANKTRTSFILNNYIEDSDGGMKNEQRLININPQDFTEGGYSRISFKPVYQSNIRSSIALSTAEKIQIQSIVVAYQPADEATVAARRSR